MKVPYWNSDIFINKLCYLRQVTLVKPVSAYLLFSILYVPYLTLELPLRF